MSLNPVELLTPMPSEKQGANSTLVKRITVINRNTRKPNFCLSRKLASEENKNTYPL